jgi:hypothetical protein
VAVDVSYSVPLGGSVYAGRLAPGAGAVAQLLGSLSSITGSVTVGQSTIATTATLSGPLAGTNGVAATLTITLNAPAPVGGKTFFLSASNSGVLGASSVTIAEGQTTGTTTLTRAATGSSTVTMTGGSGLTLLGTPLSFSSTPASSATPFLNRRTGTRYATLAQAVSGSISTDTIAVAPGTYVISTGVAGDSSPGMTVVEGGINLHTLTIEWEVPGVMPVIDLAAKALEQALGGGQMRAIEGGSNNRSLTVRGLHLIGHPRGGSDGSYGINTNAGYLPGVGFDGNPDATLTVEYCKLERWGNGVTNTQYNRNITVNLLYSYILNCTYNFLSHGVYIKAVKEFNVLGCTFRTTVAGIEPPANNSGDLLKTRARKTVVRGSLFDAAGGCASLIGLPNGGDFEATGNIFLHYGQANQSDDNWAIKWGAEENARRVTLSLSGAMPTVGQVVTGNTSGWFGTVSYVSGSTFVFERDGTGNFSIGETVSVGGTVRGTVTATAGSPDGTQNDGRTHAYKVEQNTFRKDQPGNWSGSPSTAYGVFTLWTSMTLDDGTPLLPVAVSGTMQNNIIGDLAAGTRQLTNLGDSNWPTYPNNTAVARSTINDLGFYSGTAIDCSPSVQSAAWTWAGELLAAVARSADLKRGGRPPVTVPAWRVGMAANTWKVVSSSSINDSDPKFNAAINPNGAGVNPPWHGTDGLIAFVRAWGNCVWDDEGLKLWAPIGGGHNNYGGNQAYVQAMSGSSPTWAMPRWPSGAIGNTINLDDGLETTGVHADGRPRSTHVYGGVVFAPGVGPVIVRLGSAFPASGTSTKVWKLDPVTAETTLVYDFAGSPGLGNSTNNCACYVPAVGARPARIYSLGVNSGTHLLYCNVSTGSSWTGGSAGACYASEGAQHMVYIPTIDRILHVSASGGIINHSLINLDTGAITYLGAISGMASGFAFDGTTPGLEWAPELGKVLLWHQSSNTAQMSTLTYPGNLTTAWTGGTLPVGGTNAVTPPNNSNGLQNGVFGNLRYSSALRGAFLVTGYNEPTLFYATENIG